MLPSSIQDMPDLVDAASSVAVRGARLAVLITSHNRREKTLACLRALMTSDGIDRFELHVVLVDDGSTDGTAEAVAAAYPWVQVVHGDGSLFWCRGMHRAFDIALRRGHDYYLWLNDDSQLFHDGLVRLLDTASGMHAGQGRPVIVVGSTVDEASGKLTYGGSRRASPWQPLTLVKVQPGELAQPCDTMNGNILLIPAEAARLIGNIDPAFEHAMGDIDYGLRARRRGVTPWVAPGVHGTCANNTSLGTFRDRSLPLARRWQLMLGRKGLPWRSWLLLTRRYAGPLWPLYFVWPYAKLVVTGLFGRR